MSTLVEKAAGNHFTPGAHWPASVPPADGFRYYGVYGMSLRSLIELALPQPDAGRLLHQFLKTNFLVEAAAVRTLSYPGKLSSLSGA
jgi:hypothetical protein